MLRRLMERDLAPGHSPEALGLWEERRALARRLDDAADREMSAMWEARFAPFRTEGTCHSFSEETLNDWMREDIAWMKERIHE
jgi:hypothetical protein